MCGCMLMHGAMEQEGHQTYTQSSSISQASAAPAANGQMCVHCGFPLGQDFSFCPNCGMSLKSSVCSACGQKVDPNWSACAYCGSPLGEAGKQPAHQ